MSAEDLCLSDSTHPAEGRRLSEIDPTVTSSCRRRGRRYSGYDDDDVTRRDVSADVTRYFGTLETRYSQQLGK